jgi:hypothetical protein
MLDRYPAEAYSPVDLPEIAGRRERHPMIIRNGLGWILAALIGGAIPVAAQTVRMEVAVLDGAGGRAAGGDYYLVSATAQPGGVRPSAAGGTGGLRHQAGFLGTFILEPGLDRDGDGVPDELDDDNDGDTLEDLAELTGSVFEAAWGVAAPTDSNEADSDGDGSDDAHELASGTDPGDPGSFFAITGIEHEAGGVRVSWRGRGAGSRYRVLYGDGNFGPLADVLDEIEVNVFEGAPWYTTEATRLDTDGADVRHYGIEKQ